MERPSAQHLFVSCSIFGSLWTLVRLWIGIPLVVSTTLRDHFVQFTYSASGSRVPRSFCNSFGLLAFRLCGRKEIIDCSKLNKHSSSIVGQDQAFFYN
ncbi:unnamed protein product [Trifolium pratense]|uniref:Uncharacterized protein n=1 Tax=Trifolium pratense TaxID=57577 RepID=A0ACB0JWK0_TRIPR|nr:unnamed protein product [Trifolium pratense]